MSLAVKYKGRAFYTSQRLALSMKNSGKMRLSSTQDNISPDELTPYP